MKTPRFVLLIIAVLLFSCYPKRPAIPGAEVPAAPFVQALEQQRLSFVTLKAIASVEVVRNGLKRAFDTVGIVLDSQRRLRVEAFGPLGQSALALVWDGNNVLVRVPENDRVMTPGQAGIERILGMSIEAAPLCAVLSGTVPPVAQPLEARAFCVKDRSCVVELAEGDGIRRVRMLWAEDGTEVRMRVASQELYRADRLLYRVRYDGVIASSAAFFPRTIVLESPEKNVMVSVGYTDTEINAPLAGDAFSLPDAVATEGK